VSTIGDWVALEDEVESVLKALQRLHPVAYLRLYDSKSAGNLIPAQPSDFIASHKGTSGTKLLFIEAKFSEVHESLYSCFSNNVGAGQLASARIWTRAGAYYIFLFYSNVSGLVEVWEGVHCAECRSSGSRLNKKYRRNYQTIEQAVRAELLQ
jgi:hypothetical protein